jgi:hypothetical protein
MTQLSSTLRSEDSGLPSNPIRQVQEIAGMCVKPVIRKLGLQFNISFSIRQRKVFSPWRGYRVVIYNAKNGPSVADMCVTCVILRGGLRSTSIREISTSHEALGAINFVPIYVIRKNKGHTLDAMWPRFVRSWLTLTLPAQDSQSNDSTERDKKKHQRIKGSGSD